MDNSRGWWQAAVGDFPNRLLTGQAETKPPRWWLIGLLLAACFLPRAWEAWDRDQLWTDSITFHEASLALERGDTHAAFQGLGLNLYPAILWGLRSAGLDWEVAAKWWSVVLGTLAVLPLFGWVRRQFDDAVAITACLLYAVHGKLAIVSTLAIRDATFWFAFLLTIYFVWRAVVEIRWLFFLLAGAALTLSVHLRMEGWLLVPVIVLWAGCRMLAVRPQWRKISLGTACCLAIVPLSVAAVNLTVLRSSPHWGFFRSDHVALAKQSLLRRHADAPRSATNEAVVAPAGVPAGVPVASKSVPATDFDQINLPSSLSAMKNVRTLGLLMIKSYTYVCGLLAVIGLLAWRKIYYRRDQQVLFFMSLLLMALIWIRSYGGRSDLRYFFPMVLVSFPWIALGFLAIPSALMRWTSRFVDWTPGRRNAFVAVLAAAVVVPNYFEARTTWASFMDSQAAAGRWVFAEFGPGRSIRANIEERRLVQYYSRTPVIERFSVKELDGDHMPPWLAANSPEMILVWFDPEKDRQPFDAFTAAVQARGELGYRQVPQDALPAACNDVLVLTRIDTLPRESNSASRSSLR